MLTAYLAPKEFVHELKSELINIKAIHDRLILCEGPIQNPSWAQHIWFDCQIAQFESINQAAQLLKQNAKIWCHYSFAHHRRAQLIQDKLIPIKEKKYDLLAKLPPSEISAWCLIDNNQLIYSKNTNSFLPLGEIHFNEDKNNPPSRAYLKLWDYFTIEKHYPKKGQKVVDFGSCPGGWSWVLQGLGCHVVSIDRSPLAPQIAQLPNIQFIQRNAFTLKPQDLGPIDWFFSDIICYPDKLFELIQEWRDSGLCKNFVCTIKFQGPTDFKATERFKSIPGAKVQHLFHNKHELTFSLIESP